MALDFNPVHAIFSVYEWYSGERRYMGRFLVHNGQLLILEDHHGMLKQHFRDGPLVGQNEQAIEDLSRSGFIELANEGNVQEGKQMDLSSNQPGQGPEAGPAPAFVEKPEQGQTGEDVQPATAPPAQGAFEMKAPEPVFDYLRVGMNKPQVLEIHENIGYLNGQKLSPQELDRIKYNVQNGLATLRYRKAV
jgi:hypothetical protein